MLVSLSGSANRRVLPVRQWPAGIWTTRWPGATSTAGQAMQKVFQLSAQLCCLAGSLTSLIEVWRWASKRSAIAKNEPNTKSFQQRKFKPLHDHCMLRGKGTLTAQCAAESVLCALCTSVSPKVTSQQAKSLSLTTQERAL